MSTVELSACEDDLPDQMVSTSRLRVFMPERVNSGTWQRWAGPGAPLQPLLGVQAARALLWAQCGRPEQADGLLGAVGGRVSCCGPGHVERTTMRRMAWFIMSAMYTAAARGRVGW